jgi:hypothetical protein
MKKKLKFVLRLFKWLKNHKKVVLWLIILDTILELTIPFPLWRAIDHLTGILVLFILYYLWKRKYRSSKGKQRKLGYVPSKRRKVRY